MIIVYTYIAHMLGWFVLGALNSLFRTDKTALSSSASVILGAASATLQIVVLKLVHG